jgi:hypothetical protein
MKRCFASVVAAALLLTSGCRVQVDKSKDGGDKNVKIDTPMGGLHVRTDQMSAADVGLPVYPGAQADHGGGDKSADVHMGFGKWQLHVKVVTYQTPDSRDQVMTFYRKALGRYGDVIQCNNDNPVGTPTTTREGLTCSDNGGKKNVHVDESDGLNLRAGSKRHQHLIEIKKGDSSNTKFSLVELELPDIEDNSSDSQ